MVLLTKIQKTSSITSYQVITSYSSRDLTDYVKLILEYHKERSNNDTKPPWNWRQPRNSNSTGIIDWEDNNFAGKIKNVIPD